jgi:hypothetical protein
MTEPKADENKKRGRPKKYATEAERHAAINARSNKLTKFAYWRKKHATGKIADVAVQTEKEQR